MSALDVAVLIFCCNYRKCSLSVNI